MKIISVPRVNALGLKGPEKMGESVLAELGENILKDVSVETIDVNNSDIEGSEKVIYSKSKE